MVARRFGVLVTVAGAVLAFGGLGAPGAGAGVKPAGHHVKIGPNQEFVGLVNGSTGIAAHAQIRVACPSGSVTGTGHPLAGQTFAVSLPASTAGSPGTTGPHGKTINVYQGVPPTASAGGIATFKRYGKPQAIRHATPRRDAQPQRPRLHRRWRGGDEVMVERRNAGEH